MFSSSQSVVADDQLLIRTRERQLYERALKRAIDLLGAFSLLCLLSPVLLIVAVLIALNDGFPIVYLRRVVGSGGRIRRL